MSDPQTITYLRRISISLEKIAEILPVIAATDGDPPVRQQIRRSLAKQMAAATGDCEGSDER